MKKFIVLLVCLGFLFATAGISHADSWNARKNKVKKLLKKNNLVTSDRFEIVYGQKITDRMANHYAYVLQDNETGREYLLYTVGNGNATIINNLALTPLLRAQELQAPQVIEKVVTQASVAEDVMPEAIQKPEVMQEDLNAETVEPVKAE